MLKNGINKLLPYIKIYCFLNPSRNRPELGTIQSICFKVDPKKKASTAFFGYNPNHGLDRDRVKSNLTQCQTLVVIILLKGFVTT